VVRPARPEDAGPIAEIQLRGLPEAFAGHVPPAAFPSLQELRRHWADEIAAGVPRRGMLVAELDCRVVGFVRYGPTRDEDEDRGVVGEVMTVFVEEPSQGRGVGQALLRASEAALRKCGFAAATLWMAVGNERGRRFYEAAGWRLDGGEKLEPVGDARAPCVRYRIDLATAPSAGRSP
jgi:GNAT superfamily N-acetyltransferase